VQLDYRASKFFITAETSVALDRRPSSEVVAGLIAPPGHQGLAPTAESVIVETITTRVLGRDTLIEVLMNPDSQVLQLSSLKSGYKDRHRQYRYLTDGTYSIKRFPADKAQVAAGWRNWTNTQEDVYPLAATHRGRIITEAEGLFYLIGVLDWQRVGERHAIVLFDTDGLIGLSLDFLGEERVTGDYEEITAAGVSSRVQVEQSLRRIRIDGHPLDPTARVENFNFLNYRGAVDLLVDTTKGIVVEMRGDLEYVGEVAVKLQKADFRNLPRLPSS